MPIIFYINNATIELILYKHLLSLLTDLNAGNLSIPGNKFKPKGYTIDNAKLTNVSIINILWVFLYTAQKQDIKYQKNAINKKLKIKKILNFIFKHLLIEIDFLFAIRKSLWNLIAII